MAQARNFCRSTSDAEDLVQETFVRFLAAFGKAEAMPSESVCTTYLATTLSHCFYNQVKRQKTRSPLRERSQPAGGHQHGAGRPHRFLRVRSHLQ